MSTRIADLMRLVANDAVDPHKAVEKSSEWEHARALEVGKWSLAGATALLAAVATGVFRLPEPSKGDRAAEAAAAIAASGFAHTMNIWTMVSLAVAGLLLVVGLGSLALAAQIERRYVLTLALVAKMVELRPFLKRAVDDEGASS